MTDNPNDRERRVKSNMYWDAKNKIDAIGFDAARRKACDDYEGTGPPIGESQRATDDLLAETGALLASVHRGMTLSEYLRAESAGDWLDMDALLRATSASHGQNGGEHVKQESQPR